ncbi:MAG: efflux RND transporter periplasmic adaptor subunit [Rikenellaceae bacterium]
MPPVNVKVATVDKELSSNSIWFASSTEPQYSVTIEPRVNGYLKSVEYRSGAPVKEGETIFEIEPSLIYTTYYSALASLESAKASLVEAESNYKRAIPLAVIDAISRTSLDQYRTTFAAAKANVKSAEEALKNASLNLSYTSIKAPMSGLIADSPAVAGDYVGPGTKFTTLTTISYCDTLKLPLAIPTARYLKYIDNSNSYDNKNLLSDITIILADSSEYNHKATYDYTQKEITSGNSTVVIYAKVANPSNLLKPNMFTRVRANIGNETEKIIIPQEAVTQMQGVSSVWVIKGDSTAIFRVVTVGSKYGSGWHITSGLDAGEKVATSSQLKLHEGAKVNPIY